MNFEKQRKSVRKILLRIRQLIFGGYRILIVGDSHTGVFEYIFDNNLLQPNFINCDKIGGATAYGLNNDNSITGSFIRFRNAIKRFSDYDVVIYMFGEVDCSFILWKKSSELNVEPKALIPHSIIGLSRLINSAKEITKHPYHIIAGAILPTIKDEQISSQGLKIRRGVLATQRERTDLVLHFNNELKSLAARNGCYYLDITEATLDKKNGVVKDEFLVNHTIDHHQSKEKTAALWILQLNKIIAEIDKAKSIRKFNVVTL